MRSKPQDILGIIGPAYYRPMIDILRQRVQRIMPCFKVSWLCLQELKREIRSDHVPVKPYLIIRPHKVAV